MFYESFKNKDFTSGKLNVLEILSEFTFTSLKQSLKPKNNLIGKLKICLRLTNEKTLNKQWVKFKVYFVVGWVLQTNLDLRLLKLWHS